MNHPSISPETKGPLLISLLLTMHANANASASATSLPPHATPFPFYFHSTTKAMHPFAFAAALLLLNMFPPIAAIGINWGTMASHPLDPDIVVRMLKDNGISRVKLFDADSWTVNALAKSGIEVMLAIPNDELKTMNDYGNAKDWVSQNVTSYVKNGVHIKYVGVGNEPFLQAYNGSFINLTLPALQNIQKALNGAGHDAIKATVPLNADVYDSPDDKPSSGQWRKDINSVMTHLVTFLHTNDAPFTINIYPFLSLYQNPNFPKEYAFFDGGGQTINDRGVQYTNVFDANYDTLVWALKRTGYPNTKIVVGEIGWPTDGNQFATSSNAAKFYRGFLKKWADGDGTPLRPGRLEVYLFGLLDEDMKSILPGNFERHWGLFTFDGKPKFPVDLTGSGNDAYLEAATGVQYQEAQWCVLNEEADGDKLAGVGGDLEYACALGDCTSLGYGCSCNNLDKHGNASYAFNMYFQMQDQDVRACNFGGLAKITTKNASRSGCLFPITIVSGVGKVMPPVTAVATYVFGILLVVIL